jgi:hypothetical protein
MKSGGSRALSLRMLVALVCILAGLGRAQEKDKYSGGQGTAAKPWVIHTPADLAALAADPEDWDKCFVQSRVIDMAGQPPVGSIGTFDVPFTGTYDGGGFCLRRVLVLSTTQSQPGGEGLFGVVQGKGAEITIQNLVLENPTVLGASRDTGGLVGRIHSGTLRRCGVRGGYVCGTVNTGGLAGQVGAEAALRECYSTAYVLGAEKIGGLVGLHAGLIEDCYSRTHTLAQWGDWPPLPGSVDLGGLVGYNFAGWIGTSYADCDRVLFRVDMVLVPVNRGGLVGAWLPGGSGEYFVSANYCSNETLGLAATGPTALGAPTSADLKFWGNLVATSVSDAALRQKSTFKGWDFNYIWTIAAGNTPRLRWE